MTVGAIVLAAGAATRMGNIKQLLPYRGRTLVENAVEQAIEAGFDPVVVVIGAGAELVSEAVGRTSARFVINENWAKGMGSSLKAGFGRLLEIAPDLDALAILLADQPYVAASHLTLMKHELMASGMPIAAACYGGTVGVPAIFTRGVFGKLSSISPDAGARWLLRDGVTPVHAIDLPEAAIDVDTPEDFAALNEKA